jgi:hypothetical protein
LNIKKIILCSFLFASILSAHPVIFKGGKVIWLINSTDITDIRFGQTLTRNWHSGIQIVNHKDNDQSFIASNNNLLIKRWNSRHYQANIYGLSSVGFNLDSEKSMYNLGLHSDWENRRFMVMHMVEYSSHDESIMHNFRLAFTPKIKGYKGTSIWLIGQYSNHQIDNKNYEKILPVVRVLKRNYLVEFGGNGKDTFFTLMVHF